MNRRDFVKSAAVLPAALAVPALAKETQLPTHELLESMDKVWGTLTNVKPNVIICDSNLYYAFKSAIDEPQ